MYIYQVVVTLTTHGWMQHVYRFACKEANRTYLYSNKRLLKERLEITDIHHTSVTTNGLVIIGELFTLNQEAIPEFCEKLREQITAKFERIESNITSTRRYIGDTSEIKCEDGDTPLLPTNIRL